jgi:hypothetical protein
MLPLGNIYYEIVDTDRTYQAYQVLAEALQAKAELKILERRFTIRATGISRRRMAFWGQELIPSQVVEGSWKRFTYLEIVWFRMMEILRGFDLPLGVIKQLKESIWVEISAWDLFQQPGVLEVIDQLAAHDHLDPGYRNLPEETVEAMKKDKHPWLFFMVLESLILRNHWMVLVNQKGKFVPLKMDRFEEYAKFFNVPEFIATSFVSVSLTEAIRLSAGTKEVQLFLGDLGLFTPSQIQILTLLRSEELQSLKVTMDSGAEVDLIMESKGQENGPRDLFLNLILTSGYRSLYAQSHNGTLYCESGIRSILSRKSDESS